MTGHEYTSSRMSSPHHLERLPLRHRGLERLLGRGELVGRVGRVGVHGLGVGGGGRLERDGLFRELCGGRHDDVSRHAGEHVLAIHGAVVRRAVRGSIVVVAVVVGRRVRVGVGTVVVAIVTVVVAVGRSIPVARRAVALTRPRPASDRRAEQGDAPRDARRCDLGQRR
jgi:hypothetical protein